MGNGDQGIRGERILFSGSWGALVISLVSLGELRSNLIILGE